MVVVSRRHEFSQHFRVPAPEAFEWLTDYTPEDHSLMGNKGLRESTRIAEDAILLTDTTYPAGTKKDKAIRRKKLVRLDPARLTYYNTLLTGPHRHSLYFYQLVPDGDGESRLHYTGYELSYPREAPDKRQLAEMAKAEAETWHEEWGKLAAAMERELRPKRG